VTVLKPDIVLPIDVFGDVHLESPTGHPLRLKAEGPRLQLAVSAWAGLHGLGPRSLLLQRRRLAAATRTLQRLQLSLDINVDGHRAFALGADVKTSLLARLLGLRSADIGFSSVVNFLRSRASVPRAVR
jgi:hypothetical protein